MSELKSIFSIDRDYPITKDHSIKIKQVTIGDLPVVLDLVSKIMEANPKTKVTDMKPIILKALKDDFDAIKKIFPITTDLTMEQVDKLNIVAAALILTEVFKDNADFLSQNLLPALQGLADKFGKQNPNGSLKSKN